VLDRWLTSARNTLVKQVTEALEDFDTQRAGALLASFVDDLSNWYVRRSRRRFWDGQPGALQTLHDTIDVVTRLMAPLVPFLTERVWQDLVVTTNPDGPASVHLAEWPAVDEAAIDPRLDEAMQLTRRIVELGRSARAEAKVKTRQPLSRALIPSAAFGLLDAELRAEVMAELNVERVESFASAGDLVDHSAKGNFRALGKRFGKQTPLVAGAIASADASVLAADLATHGRANVLVTELGEVEVTPDEVIVSERPREGWSVVNEQGETVALDLELTPELVAAGLAREVIRGVQEARKASGFEVSDRIRLEWTATDPATADAVRVHSALIGEEVLAVEVTEATTSQGTPTPSGIPANAGISNPTDWFGDDELGLRFRVTRVGQA
jgi:isoleucyl-tRNA synthetase